MSASNISCSIFMKFNKESMKKKERERVLLSPPKRHSQVPTPVNLFHAHPIFSSSGSVTPAATATKGGLILSMG